nr:hypothetical protein [Tanacetum cinerariifolium]
MQESRKTRNEHLYSASANKIDEKKPKLKDLPSHLEYAYLNGDTTHHVIISSKLAEKEKVLLLQVLKNTREQLPGRCFFQILIAPEDQEKTTFTCPYGTFAYRRMTSGLCDAPTTFQRCMTAIFHDMVEDFMKVFMDDFSVFGSDIEIMDEKGAENLAADHLSRLENPNIGILTEIADEFLNEHLMVLKTTPDNDEPWYADYVNYIVVADYVSKWVEAQAMPTNDARVVVKFLKGLFSRFEVPKALISDRGTHFCNSQLEKALQKYGVTHKMSTAFHHQTNGETEVTNRAIKFILECPFTVKTVYPYGAVEIIDKNNFSFMVNGHRIKKYYDGCINMEGSELVELNELTGHYIRRIEPLRIRRMYVRTLSVL